MDKARCEWQRHDVCSSGLGPFRPDFGDIDRAGIFTVAMNQRDEIVLTVGPLIGSRARHSTRLAPGEARRLAADLLAFAGVVDGSLGE